MTRPTRDFKQFARAYPALPPFRIALTYAEREVKRRGRIPPDTGFMLTYVIRADLTQNGRKYSEDQPRVPAGQAGGGQWTSGDEGGDPNSDTLQPSENPAIQLAADITGFTKHGINQAINRGVSPAAILDAVNNPIKILPQLNGTIRYVGRDAVVVLNPAGGIVTLWGQ